MKKILDISTPIIDTLQDYANVFSILMSHKTSVSPWIADHFIQICAINPHLSGKLSVHFIEEFTGGIKHSLQITCPFLDTCVLNRSLIPMSVDVTSYTKNAIDQGYYFQLYLNQYHLPSSTNYGKGHYMHPTFIYGYDDYQQVFYISDFFKYIYSREIVPYFDYNNAFNSYCNPHFEKYWLDNIVMTKFVPYQYDFDLSLMRNSLEEYLNAKKSQVMLSQENFLIDRKEYTYGINMYDILREMSLDARNSNDFLDRRPFHLLLNHKQLFVFRIEWLFKNNYLTVAENDRMKTLVNKLYQQSLTLRNMVLKYNCSMSKELVNRIIEKCDEIQIDDMQAVGILLDIV